MPRRFKMSKIRDTDIAAIDLAAIDLTLQFVHQAGITCNKGLNIRMVWASTGIAHVSVEIVGSEKDHELQFYIEDISEVQNWKIYLSRPLSLNVAEKKAGSEQPSRYSKETSDFKIQENENGNFSFASLQTISN